MRKTPCAGTGRLGRPPRASRAASDSTAPKQKRGRRGGWLPFRGMSLRQDRRSTGPSRAGGLRAFSRFPLAEEGHRREAETAPYDPTRPWVKVKNPTYSQKEGRQELFNPRRRPRMATTKKPRQSAAAGSAR